MKHKQRNNVGTDTENNSDDNVSPNKLISITTSLNNLSLSQNDIENYSNESKVSAIDMTTDNKDGYKIMYEATQRKLSIQNEKFQRKVSQLKSNFVDLNKEYDVKSRRKKDGEYSWETDDVIISTPSTEITPSSHKCIHNECNKDSNRHMLMCSKCKRFTHYGCTELPPYQVSLFLQKGYRLYQCKECVGEIHSDIINNVMNNECVKIIFQKGVDISTQVFHMSDSEIETTKTLDRKINEIERITDEWCKEKSVNTQLIKRIEELEEQLNVEKKQRKSKEKEMERVKNKLTRKQCNMANKSTQLSETNNDINEDTSKPYDIDSKFQQFSATILDKVTQIIDDKLSHVGDQFQTIATIPEKLNENYKTFKDVLSQNIPTQHEISNIKELMVEERNEQLVQERERKLRAANIIIHGVNEAPDSQATELDDQEYVTALFQRIGVYTEPENVTRLGKSEESKTRPLKVKLKTETEKELVMARLPNLKNAEDRFRKIRVTDDYTIQEREEIKKWVLKAKEKNVNEKGNFTWRARGTPKNGMRLARFVKQ